MDKFLVETYERLNEIASEWKTLPNAWRFILSPENSDLLGSLSENEIVDLYSRFSLYLENTRGIVGDEGLQIPGACNNPDYFLEEALSVNGVDPELIDFRFDLMNRSIHEGKYCLLALFKSGGYKDRYSELGSRFDQN